MFRFRLGTSLFQMRRWHFIFGMIFLIFFLGTIYVLPSLKTVPAWKTSVQTIAKKDDFSVIEQRLDKIEKELQRSREMVAVLKNSLKGWIGWIKVQPPSDNSFIANDDIKSMSPKQICILFPEKCDNSEQSMTTYLDFKRLWKMGDTDCSFCTDCPKMFPTDEDIFEIYKQIDFVNTDGGVWKQGWDLEYDPKYWNKNKKLKIFVVPHSHNDPGWIKTFEKYYSDQTQHILNNMVLKMKDDKRRKFIWAEISFFAHWWEKIDKKTQNIVKKLINDGQLEIVTGGWVMNDEATSHYFAMIEQMFEGHQWLQQNLGFKPKSAWAIDPFGLSSTMPYLLTQMGLNNMVIQRVHYSVKKYLASKKRLEFVWLQSWEKKSDVPAGIFCHIMPFYSYDIPHTCGPDPKVCCQYDFKRLPGNRVNCPWKKPPVAITDKNVAERASTLLDQYRKKSLLFKSNVVMIQLGDDFRYDKASEWDQQFNNYQKLFDYINNQEDWNAEVQFGTLSDYFTALQKDMKVSDTNISKEFPTLSGDFFTYADRDEHYWSGFFTSRPFYKNMDRALEAHLRAAEILFSLVLAKIDEKSIISMHPYVGSLMTDLISSTRTLSLFQHHDAITGTARDHVVVDYASKMSVAFQKLRHIIGQCAVFLLAPNTQDAIDEEIALLQTDEYRHHNSLPTKKIITFPVSVNSRQIILFNSLGYSRKELVKVIVSKEISKVIDENEDSISFQVTPVYVKNKKGADFELSFVAELQALSLETYTIHALPKRELSEIGLFNSKVYVIGIEHKKEEKGEHVSDFSVPPPVVQKEFIPYPAEEFSLSTPFLDAYFNASTGMLKRIKYFNAKSDMSFTVDIDIKFLKYGTKNKGKDKSGAYLFLPDGEAKEIDYGKPYIRIIEGSLYSECVVLLREVEHHVILKNSPGVDSIGLHIYNIINIASEYNKELVMRLVTHVNNDELEFFTDLNGFQMTKRQYFSKLPLQANVYPVTSIAYMEDSEKRFTFLTGHSVGITCLQKGVFDIFLDRRLNQDDNRGLQQGITDNKDTPAHFRIFFEHWDNFLGETNGYYPSLLAHHASLSLLHPIFSLIRLHTDTDPTFVFRNPDIQLETTYSPLKLELPCNIHILNLKPLSIATNSGFIPAGSSVLNLHHMGYDCFFEMLGNCSVGNKNLSIHRVFPDLFGKDAEETSLSLLYSGRKISRNQSFQVPHMEIVTFKLSYK